MSNQINAERRRFIRTLAGGAGSVPVVLLGISAPAGAGDLPRLAMSEPAARALAYVEDATTVSHAAYKPGSKCSNCNFLTGEDGADWRPCSLFPNNRVAADGWCSAWAKKL